MNKEDRSEEWLAGEVAAGYITRQDAYEIGWNWADLDLWFSYFVGVDL